MTGSALLTMSCFPTTILFKPRTEISGTRFLSAAYRPEQGREDSRPANQHRIQHTGGTGTLQTGSDGQVKGRCLCKD